MLTTGCEVDNENASKNENVEVSMQLLKMTEAEFNEWAPRSRAGYAKDKMRANAYTQKEAEEIAEKDFARILPEGLNSKDSYLYSLNENQLGRVGFIWFRVQGAEENRKAFVCDIIVEPEFRGRGFGKLAMLGVEDEARKLGLKGIGLHVFGFNEPAIRLYQSLGYETTDLVMAKSL